MLGCTDPVLNWHIYVRTFHVLILHITPIFPSSPCASLSATFCPGGCSNGGQCVNWNMCLSLSLHRIRLLRANL